MAVPPVLLSLEPHCVLSQCVSGFMETEGRFRVYKEAPGFRPVPRVVTNTSAWRPGCVTHRYIGLYTFSQQQPLVPYTCRP